MINQNFKKIFPRKPIIGMIHLAGINSEDRIARAIREIKTYDKFGFDGALVENYHGSLHEVLQVMQRMQPKEPNDSLYKKLKFWEKQEKLNLKLGVNILSNEYDHAFPMVTSYGGSFIQVDRIAGNYKGVGGIQNCHYDTYKNQKGNKEIVVLGGVWPKYYQPVDGSDLKADIEEAKKRAEAIVVTGAGTGIETSLDKVKLFRAYCGEHPLILAAGATAENISNYWPYIDGVIIGSYLKKDRKTENELDLESIAKVTSEIQRLRAN